MSGSSKRAELRQSQLITTFGPGAMVDLPTRSVIIGGLDRWDMQNGTWRTLSEPRAVMVLQDVLRERKGLSTDVVLTLRTPPLDPQLPGREPPGIDATIFPCWFVTDTYVQAVSGQRRRRLVPWSQLDPAGGRQSYRMDDGTKTNVTPIRFVAACEKGHIQDIDWSYRVHGAIKCGEALWLEEVGTTGEPHNTRIVCECGKSLTLAQAQIPGRLGQCTGKRPWLTEDDPNGCDKPLRFLTRTATNAYFPQVLTVISLPSSDDELSRQIERHWDVFGEVSDFGQLGFALKFNAKAREAVTGHSLEDVWAKIERRRSARTQDLDKKPRYAEFDMFASGDEVIGENRPGAELFGQTLPREAWGDAVGAYPAIGSVVAVHRLREVSCLYGFTRFEAAPTSIDGELEEVFIAVHGAEIASELRWLPAVEQFGEGLFLHFDSVQLAAWAGGEQVRQRDEVLRTGFAQWAQKRYASSKPPAYPGVGYTLLHSFSHALMTEIALDCGYPASALKERIYALTEGAGVGRYGVLIYTASAGSQGTLGGLVAAIPRLATMIARTLDRLILCSSDPICADHKPNNHTDDRALHGAACHSCLLIAETSCEHRNLFLDRALVTQTVARDGSGMFG